MTKIPFSELDLTKVGNTIQLIGAVWGGEGHAYYLAFPEYAAELSTCSGKVSRILLDLEATHADWKRLLLQSDSVETEVLQKSEDGSLYKSVIRKCERVIAQQVSWNVFRRDGFRCRYCGTEQLPLTVDHVVLWEAGGPSIEDNLVSACKPCNKVRGRIPYEKWLQHPYYLERYKNLTPEARLQNEQLLDRLESIPRFVNTRSR